MLRNVCVCVCFYLDVALLRNCEMSIGGNRYTVYSCIKLSETNKISTENIKLIGIVPVPVAVLVAIANDVDDDYYYYYMANGYINTFYSSGTKRK